MSTMIGLVIAGVENRNSLRQALRQIHHLQEIFKFSELDEVNKKQEDESSLPLFQVPSEKVSSFFIHTSTFTLSTCFYVVRQTEDIMETDVVSPHISETLLVSQPQCCKTTDCGSSNSAGCPFQALGEHLTGVKLSTNNKDKRICIVASHPSSGTYFLLAHSLCAKVLK
ncbi:hypothetical protein DY000_02023937 [Brassica cretica]|uniref:DUF7806 domain-containing protein n=1 Tax=Brassica cretica TaxID=69181 RepID=A0ABQ7EHC8_BRACR|nr:hypothetical protein DY000_02023937 [Brassica cretica]